MEIEENEVKKENLSTLKDRRKVDTLLGCLLFLAKYHKRETSAESLTFGLSLHEKSMNLKLFYQASERIGLIPKTVDRPKLINISRLALPSVLILSNDRHCVLIDIDFKKQEATVILPGLSNGETIMSIEKLESEYTGSAIIVKPAYDFKNRIQKEKHIPNPKHWFWDTLKISRGIYSQVILASIFINIFVIATPLFTMNVYDRVLPNNAMETLWVLFFGITIVMFFDLALKLIRTYFLGIASKKADVIMSNKIFDQLLNIKIEAKPASTGIFISRLQSFENVREFFTSATIAILVDLPFVIIFIILIAYIGGLVALIPITALVINICLSWYSQKNVKKIVEESTREDQRKQTTLIETVTGLEIVKNVRAQSRMKTHWEDSVEKTVHFTEKGQYLSQAITTITSFIGKFSNILVVVVGVYFATKGEMTMGAIIACMMLNSRVLAPVSKLVSMITRFDKTVIAFNNIDELMNMPVEKQDKTYISRPNIDGDIELKDVDFRYKGQNFDILKNLNIKIKKGEKIAILGKIGSGKSTLLKVILNLYEPTNGSILLDNTDTRQIDPVDLRKAIGVVPQEPFLFMGTIKDNITVAEQYATDDEVVRAAELSGLSDFIGRHESGFDLMVGERGEGLSGGEKQSVTLARALLADPKIIMLDEPTNSMDRQSERAFIKNLREVAEDKTLVIVTHKMSLLTLVDRVIILEDGKVIADGIKEEIFGKKGVEHV